MRARCELDTPSSWLLKGEGNANAVFSYTGSHTSLVRISVLHVCICRFESSVAVPAEVTMLQVNHVLRIRKLPAPSGSEDQLTQELDKQIWGKTNA